MRVLDVTTQDGEIHPFYAANKRTRVLTPAESLQGHWAPSRAGFGAAMGAMARWPINAAARAARDPVIVISADAETSHQAVIRVMDAARRAGLTRVTFVTRSPLD